MCGQEKNEKKPQASGLTVRASQEHVSSAPGTCLRTAGVRNPRRNTPNGQRARSGSLAPAGAGFPVAVTLRTGSGGLCELCEHCNTFRAVCMRSPAEEWEFEAIASTTLFVVFSSVRKRHFFFFGKERTHAFLYRKKSIKRTASLRLDRLCGRQRFGGGYKRRHPRSRSSRDPSIAAGFVGIIPEGAHAARALRLRARAFQWQLLSARRMTESAHRCAAPSVGSREYTLPSRSLGV